MLKLLVLTVLCAVAHSQNFGTLTPESPLSMNIQTCTASGCTNEALKVVLDSNWRWTHANAGATNCYTGNTWDRTLCPDPDTCTANCAIDGVASGDWQGTYGITGTADGVAIKFITDGPFSRNVGSRMYLLENGGTSYKMFSLLNREFSFDVDDHELTCGLNGAFYLVEMDKDGGLAEFPTNKAGAKYGTGYCDAQCPHDMKWINGEANSLEWRPSENDQNSGKGHYGICCAEFDLWEANKEAQAYTSHPCSTIGYHRCEDVECGDNEVGERYEGVCDKDGCDFASYRHGDREFFGPGANYAVDSTKKVTVVTQFITDDGTDNGDLAEIRRFYVQDGEVIENSVTNIPGVDPYDSITEQFCTDTKEAFGDFNDHMNKGGLVEMGAALKRGMVLVMSLWDDHDAFMLWLDSTYPVDADPSTPGVVRGPCPTTSGRPEDIEAEQPNASVRFSNIKYGPIGSTNARK